MPLLSIISAAFCVVMLFFIIQDYQTMKNRMPRLVQLEKENGEQRKQFRLLAQRVNQISQKVGRLKDFDHKLRVMVNLETGEDGKEFQGVGGSDPALLDPKRSLANSHKELVRSMYHALDNLNGEVALAEKGKAEIYKFLENQKMLLACTPSIWPTKGWLSSRFGFRVSPFTGQKEFHKGIDIATRMGAPITAAADGIVENVRWDYGYGRVLSLRHGYGLETRYAHLKKALVKKGQYVKRGETIALVGNSGRSTGPHLHYEVHLNKVCVDPLRYILN